MRPRIFAPAILSFVAISLLPACGGMDLGDVNVFSESDEWRLGEQLSADLARKLDVVEDPTVVRIVNDLGMELVRRTDMADRPWRFHVVRDPAINAFNVPGGHVYVNTGLIAAADDASELAGVMAHEVAHGVERHATQQMTKAYGISMLLDLALGRNPGVLEGLAGNIVAGGTLARYSREAEEEADSVGVRMMAAAGYHPEGMVGLFEELLETRNRRPGELEQFFASHPLTEDRIEHVRRVIATLPPDPAWRRDTDAVRTLKDRVR